MYPSLACKIEQGYITPNFPVEKQFNQIWIELDAGGTDIMYAVWECDPELSTFLPAVDAVPSLSNTDFNALWGPIVGLLVAGFIVRTLLRAID